MQFYARHNKTMPPQALISQACSPHLTPWLVVVAAMGLYYPALASGEEACPTVSPVIAQPQPTAALQDQPVHIRADEILSVQSGVSEFSGQVELERADQRLKADWARYDKTTDTLDATGNVTFENDAGDSFQTPELHLQFESRIGHTGPGTYTLGRQQARGGAERIDFEGPDKTRLSKLRYTTCAQGQDSWFLKARELELDQEKGIGIARHATVIFQGVPIFYLPYLSFPLDNQRKSGFLTPEFGRSDKLGTVVGAPYYWNIAPNYDATITPRILSKRGLQVQNEFRYLGRNSGGMLELEFLVDDNERNGDDRAAGTYVHRQTLSPLWSANVDIRRVSDKEYLNDFGDNLGVTSQTHLPQNAAINYRGSLWSFAARASDYQTVDRTIVPIDRPYARLPHLTLSANAPSTPNRLRYEFDSEWVNFSRDASITGKRLNLNPAVSLPLSNSYGFLTPRVGIRHISYNLSGTSDTRPSLTRGVYSLDSGLFFERDTRWGGRAFVQTLEPRLYYLYVPHKDQDALPNFDTGEVDLSFNNLFRDNRFIGGDRVGDANQATLALTTRFIGAEDGAERLRASIGQIYYFDDRLVNLPAGTVTRNTSDTVAEVTARFPGNWYVQGNIQRDLDAGITRKSNIYVQYQPGRNKIINFGRRFIQNDVKQTDISTEWPIFGRWTFRARSLYSQRDHRNIESHVGIEYNACCWAVRVAASRRFVGGEQIKAIMFQLELTGLSKLGKVPVSPLKQSVFSFPSQPAQATGAEAP